MACAEAVFKVGTVTSDTFVHCGIDVPGNLAAMAQKRRGEYLAGRLCARRALAQGGHADACQVSCSPDRSPRWPQGWVGSISHCAERAVAVAAPCGAGRRLGVDIERIMADDTAARLADDILCAEDKLQPLEHLGVAVTVIFSAKEALFKALYPDVQRFFGFECAAVISYEEGRARLRLRKTLCERWPAGREIIVHHAVANQRVYALADITPL